MHHFIYPSQDTFITNTIGYASSSFGLDEILRVGTKVTTVNRILPTRTAEVSASAPICVSGFSGSIINASISNVTSSVAIGTISSSMSTIYTSYFTGDVDGSTVYGFSGSMSGSITGSVSGILLASYVDYFNGSVAGFSGKILTGNLVGEDILNQQNTVIENLIYVNRALIQFDLNQISESIVKGDISNPQFSLKLNVAREEELPIKYSIYAYPILQSWVMGTGYVSDGGSLDGASWIYRDTTNQLNWDVTGSSYDTSSVASQQFNYQVGDVYMDVTNIVNGWIYSGSQNNGFLIVSSDEFSTTGSGMGLYFFSKDTNTIYEPRLDVSWNDDFSWSTGSITTSSANITSVDAGLMGIVSNNSVINGALYGGFTGVSSMIQSSSISYSFDIQTSTTSSTTTVYASGIMAAMGVNGLILSMSIVGNFSGSISSSIATVIKTCQSCTPQFNAGFNYSGGQNQTQYEGHDIYGWGHAFNEFNQYDWTSDHVYQQEFGPGFSGSNCDPSYQVTSSFLMGTLESGIFSGSTFTSSLINGYILGYGNLVGSWNQYMINGTNINASYPFIPMYPSAIMVGFTGSYVNGQAFGGITHLSSSYGVNNYGIFDGVFTSGPLMGISIHAPFSGSILSSSYFYTGSLNLISSSLTPIDTKKPFTAVIQNMPTTINAGDIIKINVFARQEFPIKNFNRQTQFTQFLTPQYLPSSSYYEIKDNETEEIILGFDNYTRISCDSTGNYFLLDTTGYPQERYFRLLIRVEDNGTIYTFDKDNIFKIVR